jgi:hypothetical protein
LLSSYNPLTFVVTSKRGWERMVARPCVAHADKNGNKTSLQPEEGL